MSIYFVLIFIIILNFLCVKYFKVITDLIPIKDFPNKRKLHHRPVPLLGGPILMMNIFVLTLFINFKTINYFYNFNINLFFIFCLIIFIFGILDDIYSLNPNKKFFILIALFALYIYFEKSILIQNISISFLSTDVSLGKYATIFTIICILCFVNAFNMFDGINLQSSFYSIFLLFCLFVLDRNILYLLIIIFFLFFSYLNYKEKSFLGNSGSYLISFALSVMFILNHNSNNIDADFIFVLMSIPGLELIRLTGSRLIEGLHPFYPDRNHIHHLLVSKYSLIKSILILNILINLQLISYLLFKKSIISIFLGIIIYIVLIIYLKKKNFK